MGIHTLLSSLSSFRCDHSWLSLCLSMRLPESRTRCWTWVAIHLMPPGNQHHLLSVDVECFFSQGQSEAVHETYAFPADPKLTMQKLFSFFRSDNEKHWRVWVSIFLMQHQNTCVQDLQFMLYAENTCIPSTTLFPALSVAHTFYLPVQAIVLEKECDKKEPGSKRCNFHFCVLALSLVQNQWQWDLLLSGKQSKHNIGYNSIHGEAFQTWVTFINLCLSFRCSKRSDWICWKKHPCSNGEDKKAMNNL